MANKFWKWFKSYDTFGEPVVLNYEGDKEFRTGLGALVTITIKIFLLVFALTQTLALLGY